LPPSFHFQNDSDLLKLGENLHCFKGFFSGNKFVPLFFDEKVCQIPANKLLFAGSVPANKLEGFWQLKVFLVLNQPPELFLRMFNSIRRRKIV
jgi:hypothetical protein